MYAMLDYSRAQTPRRTGRDEARPPELPHSRKFDAARAAEPLLGVYVPYYDKVPQGGCRRFSLM